MKKIVFYSLIVISALLINACKKEIARIPLNKVSTEENKLIKETSFDIEEPTEILICSDMNYSFKDDQELRFRIFIYKDGKEYKYLEIDPTDMMSQSMETKTTINNKTNWSFKARNKKITLDKGHYTFKGFLAASDNPTLKIKKAEIVFKK